MDVPAEKPGERAAEKPAEKPIYYEKIEVVPAGDWRELDFIRAMHAPDEPDDMRELRMDIQATGRVATVFFKNDRTRKDEFLTRLHQVADTGLRGMDFTIPGARSDLANVKQALVDTAYDIRSAILQDHTRASLYVGLPTFIAGLIVYYGSLRGYFLPPEDGQFPIEVIVSVAALWIPAGAAVGTWAEFALRTETLTFERLLYFDPGRWSPAERLRITIIVAFVLAFFLGVGAVQVGLGSILLNEFATTRPYCSLAIGFISGFAFPYVRDILYRQQPVTK